MTTPPHSRLPAGLIVASLLLNAVLAALFLAGRAAPAPTAEHAPAPAPASPAAPTVDAQTWSTLRSPVPRDFAAQLTAQGFPPDVVRTMVAAELGQRYLEQRRALDRDQSPRPFWKNSDNDLNRSPALRQLARENEKILRDMFGDLEAEEPTQRFYWQRQTAGLSSEKADAVRRIIRDFNSRRQDIYQDSPSISAAGRTRLQALESEQRTALAAALGPQDFETYQLWNGQTAQTLRFQLANFQPTEEEFLTLYRLRRPLDEQWAANAGRALTPEEMQQQGLAQQRLNEQIKAALGPARAAEYERSSDYSYQLASRLVERLALPAATAIDVWTLQKDVTQRFNAVQGDRTLPAEARQQQVSALASEAKTKLAASLGERGLAAYRTNGGEWLQMFDPPPPRKR